jgi:hypothetical protein
MMNKGIPPYLVGGLLLPTLLLGPIVSYAMGQANLKETQIGDIVIFSKGNKYALQSPLTIKAMDNENNECEFRPSFMARDGGSLFVTSIKENGRIEVSWRGGMTSIRSAGCENGKLVTLSPHGFRQLQRIQT